MGEWHLLHKRFAYFSQEERIFLYFINNGVPGSLHAGRGNRRLLFTEMGNGY
jgi:hypothetical protein